MTSSHDQVVRGQLSHFLTERNAHVNMDDVLDDFPEEHINAKMPGVEYTPWQLLEHIRLTQDDIIDFIKNPDYTMPPWPEGYWPSREEQADKGKWEQTVEEVRADLEWFKTLLQKEDVDLYRSMPAGEKYSIFREVLVVIDHNSHHLGQLVLFRKFLNAWK